MKNSEKNRDPERARTRAKSDARCALRKLNLLSEIARWRKRGDASLATDLLNDLADALDVTEDDR